jgi:hypothetical protein
MTRGAFVEVGSFNPIPFLQVTGTASAVHGLPVTDCVRHPEGIGDFPRGHHVHPVALETGFGSVGTAGPGRIVALGARVVGPYPSRQLLAGGNCGEMGFVTKEDGGLLHVPMAT